MSDPYRPAYYPPPDQQRYDSHDYSNVDQYGPLIPQHRTSNASYNPPQSSEYVDSEEPPRRHRRHSRSRSRSRSHRSKSLRRSLSRGAQGLRRSLSRGAKDRPERSHRSKSRTKELGATAVGGAAGAWLGHELGHSALGTVGGLVVGAIGARELEKRHERHRLERDVSRVERDGVHAGEDLLGVREDGHRRRRSSGGFVDQFREKVGGLLDPGEKRGDDRRSRSHVGSGGGSGRGGGSRRHDSDDSDSEGDYAPPRRRRGSRRGRDDYD